MTKTDPAILKMVPVFGPQFWGSFCIGRNRILLQSYSKATPFVGAKNGPLNWFQGFDFFALAVPNFSDHLVPNFQSEYVGRVVVA